VLGDNHHETLDSMSNLANMCSVQGNFAEAEVLLRQVLEGDRRMPGESHPDTLKSTYNMACLAALRGDRPGAIHWLDQAVSHGYDHWELMEKDSDLKSLKGDPAFRTLIDRARKNSGR